MLLILLLTTILLERLIFTGVFWKLRTAAVFILAASVPALSISLLFIYPNWIGLMLVAISTLRIFNMTRIAKARMHELYLRRSANRTSLFTSLLQSMVLIALVLPLHVTFGDDALLITMTVMLAVALLIFVITLRNMYATRYKQGSNFYSDKELPTVSLLIPARNETYQLEECLRTALASNYPKLEIIVLDDCSHKKTSEIIKGFAQKGVRFVKGLPPAENWLAKNQAYKKLSSEASGELLLFCGVDVRFGANAITALVTETLNRDKQMISVLPHRLSSSIAGAFVQPMRYWWELSLPRKLFNRPPVLSSSWLIKKTTLHKFGGFDAVARSITPEGYFARETIKTNDYSFIRANDILDIQTRKSLPQQRSTAIRTRYPQLKRRPENVFIVCALQLLFLLGPFIGMTYSLSMGATWMALGFGVASILLALNHAVIVYFTSPANAAISLVTLPLEVVIDIYLLTLSMIRYEFGNVIWKDRNVCIPVMHVVPKLPGA